MKITCGSCAAKYTVSDDKVQGKTVKVKCRKCGAVIVVSSTGDVQTTGGSSAGAPAPGGDATYTVSVSDTDQRNMTLAEIIAAYNEGAIDAETYVWAEGMDDWQPLKDIDAIVDALHEAATNESGGDDDLSRTVAMSDPAAALGSYGGASQPAAAADHFGASTVAMSSPADAGGSGAGLGSAAAPAGTTGNFFGGAGGGSNAGAATAAASSTSAENSAIFSLNMLTAKVGTEAAPAKASTGGSEDSGLIDLKALAAGMGGSDSGAGVAAAAPAGGLFPLGAPPPVAASAPMTSIPAPAQSGPNRGMVIGLAAAVVVLGAALVFILVRDSGPPPSTAATGQPTAAATPTPAPTPTETAPTAEPSAVASAAPSASASATTKVATKGTTTRPTTPTKPTAGGPSTAAPPKPPPKPAGGGGCGCSPDDLMCHMRCSQKK